jgi:hypothetical protein
MADVDDVTRQAIYDEDCEKMGHTFDFNEMVGPTDLPNPHDPNGWPKTVLRARDPLKLPHLVCTHCGRVWILFDADGGKDYEDAIEKLQHRMGVPIHPKKLESRIQWGVGVTLDQWPYEAMGQERPPQQEWREYIPHNTMGPDPM